MVLGWFKGKIAEKQLETTENLVKGEFNLAEKTINKIPKEDRKDVYKHTIDKATEQKIYVLKSTNLDKLKNDPAKIVFWLYDSDKFRRDLMNNPELMNHVKQVLYLLKTLEPEHKSLIDRLLDSIKNYLPKDSKFLQSVGLNLNSILGKPEDYVERKSRLEQLYHERRERERQRTENVYNETIKPNVERYLRNQNVRNSLYQRLDEMGVTTQEDFEKEIAKDIIDVYQGTFKNLNIRSQKLLEAYVMQAVKTYVRENNLFQEYRDYIEGGGNGTQ